MDKEFFMVLNYNTKMYIHSAIGTKELAKIVKRREQYVKDLVNAYDKSRKKDKELIITNRFNEKYLIITQKEMERG